MGVVMGYLQMRQAEDYWTSEYLAYAKDSAEKAALKDEQSKKEEAAEASACLQTPPLETSSSTINVEVK